MFAEFAMARTLLYSRLLCIAGYRGYGCTDDTEAISKSLQKLEMLLLILSNLLFGVAGAVAIYRKWFSEALLYFFVLFASSVRMMACQISFYSAGLCCHLD